MSDLDSVPTSLVSTGVLGLDPILGGGLARDRLYLVEGVPGSGKTTLGLQFLLAGVEAGESVLYVTLSESEAEIRSVARSHGWTLEGVGIYEVLPGEHALLETEQYTVFQPEEVELGETTRSILAEVERRKPVRLVLDSLSELRLLAGSALRYRRQMLGLKQFFSGRRCTVVVLDDRTGTHEDGQLHSIVHGIVSLDQWYPEYGRERRRVRIVKYRGMRFVGGYHDANIVRGGLVVYPRLTIVDHSARAPSGPVASDVAGLDQLLGGGLDRGTSTLIVGPPGSGKSTIAASFSIAAARRGERAAIFLFDEAPATLCTRMDSLGFDLTELRRAGRVDIAQIDPAERSPGEFAQTVADAVRVGGASVVVIDSLNGYLNAMPDEKYLTSQLHELLAYIGQLGAISILVSVQKGLMGAGMTSAVDASYLADTVLMLRYFEAGGRVRRAISALKKRTGPHERALREFDIDSEGVIVGEPLHQFRGVLSGVPEYVGNDDPLIRQRNA